VGCGYRSRLAQLSLTSGNRALSIAIPVSYVLLAVLRLTTGASSPAGQAAPLVGAQERTMVYSFLSWVMALAIHLLLSRKGGR